MKGIRPRGEFRDELELRYVCKNCGHEITLVNYVMGPTWMHVDQNDSFPTESKGSLWRYCKQSIAEPKE